MPAVPALVSLPLRLIGWLLRRALSLLAAASGATLVFLVTTVLLLALNTATLLSSTVFGFLSSAAEFVFDDSLRKRQAAVQSENAHLRQNLEASERALLNSRAENARLQGELRGKTAEADRLRNQLEAKRRQTRDLARRIKTRTANAATVNIGAVWGEAIPVVGIGVIVAATGYELRAACETMRDMDELMTMLDGREEESEETYKVCGFEVPDPEMVWRSIANSPGAAWRGAQEAWADTASGIPDHLPTINAPGRPEAVLDALESLRTWLSSYFWKPWADPVP